MHKDDRDRSERGPWSAQARSRQCAADGCGKRPVFNFQGEKLPVFCQAHKQEGMVDVLNRLCTSPGTSPISLFDYGNLSRQTMVLPLRQRSPMIPRYRISMYLSLQAARIHVARLPLPYTNFSICMAASAGCTVICCHLYDHYLLNTAVQAATSCPASTTRA